MRAIAVLAQILPEKILDLLYLVRRGHLTKLVRQGLQFSPEQRGPFVIELNDVFFRRRQGQPITLEGDILELLQALHLGARLED